MKIRFMEDRYSWTEVEVWDEATHIPRTGDVVCIATGPREVVRVIWESPTEVRVCVERP